MYTYIVEITWYALSFFTVPSIVEKDKATKFQLWIALAKSD